MRRRSPYPLVALCLAMGCAERATGPEPSEPRTTGLSFKESQGHQECDGTLPPGTYKNVYVPPGASCFMESSRVEGNLMVFEGAFLNVEGTTITGNLKMKKESRANVINTFVQGNLEGNQISALNAGSVSVIGGNVVIKNSSGGGASIELATIEVLNGDIRILNNNGSSIEVDFVFVHNGSVDIRKNTVANMLVDETLVAQDIEIIDNQVASTYLVQQNTVGGNLEVLDNQSPTATVSLNTVTQTLRCFDNTVVFVGGPNIAGNAEGQCF